MRRKIWSGRDVSFDSVGVGIDLKFGGEALGGLQGGEGIEASSFGGEALTRLQGGESIPDVRFGGESIANAISGGESVVAPGLKAGGEGITLASISAESAGIYLGAGGEALQARVTA